MNYTQRKKKQEFKARLKQFTETLSGHVATSDAQWTVKGFIDVFKNVYTISTDTKIVSKILEIHLLPLLLKFAQKHAYHIILAEHQNYYPDISFVSAEHNSIKFAVDLKTTYRLPNKPGFCNGFTLGSHGSYFINRNSHKNIQFPYDQYLGHFCLGIIYTRADSGNIDQAQIYPIDKLHSIVSVIKNIQFFACEKWEIASDSQGSGNTANIGSIVRIDDILAGNGVFKNLGENWFDEYWMNYGKINIKTDAGKQKKITNLRDFLRFKGLDPKLANPCIRTNSKKEENK